MVGGDVVGEGTDVVAILPVAGDDMDVGYAGVGEIVALAVGVGNVTDFPSIESAPSYTA
jgi:hypothetical protein